MKPVFQTTTTLHPRLDESHIEVALDIVKWLRQENPEYEELWWSVSLKELPNGTAVVSISVLDPKQPSPRENAKLIFWLIGIAIVIGLLAYA